MAMSPAARFLGFLCSMISCEVQFPAPNVLPNVNLNYDYQPVLKTVYGEVRGHYMTTIKGRNVASFEGIPFAEPPVGDLRFAVSIEEWCYIEIFDEVSYNMYFPFYSQNPEKKKPWKEPLDGTKKGPICIQMDPFKYFNIQGISIINSLKMMPYASPYITQITCS